MFLLLKDPVRAWLIEQALQGKIGHGSKPIKKVLILLEMLKTLI